MGGPGDAAAQQTEEEVVDSFEDKVSIALKEVKKSDEGKLIFPEGTDESVKYAARAELRFRHTQSEYDKNKHELRVLKAENEALSKYILPKLDLTVEQKEELEDLKGTNPEAWRDKVNQLEKEAKSKIDDDVSKVKLSARQEAEKERRREVLDDFISSNPELGITDEVMSNDIPPRIKSKLEKGEVTFEEFLVEVKDYLSKAKKVSDKTLDTDKDPDLNKVGGGSTATNEAVEKDIIQSYNDAIF